MYFYGIPITLMTPNTGSDAIIIPLNKAKLTLMFIGSLTFVALGIWFVYSPVTFSRYNIVIITLVGCSSIAFFGMCAVFIFIKFFDQKPGLVIDKDGITDNASALSAGLIPWKDLTGLSVRQVQRQRFMMLMVKNPEEYIARQNNAFKRKLAQMNYKFYGSPISISTNGLKYNFDRLHTLIAEQLEKHS